MRRLLSVLLVTVMLLSLCACTTEPQTTDPTEEDTKPVCVHKWQAATCSRRKTCTLCGAKEGEALGHTFEKGECTVCGAGTSDYNPLLGGTWLHITRQRWQLFTFQPDGTCDVMVSNGMPTADYDMEQCVKTSVASLKRQYGDDWTIHAKQRFYVAKIYDYYYVLEMTMATKEYTVGGELITIGNIPPLSYLIIINEKVLESGENEDRFTKADFTYIGNLYEMFNKIQ